MNKIKNLGKWAKKGAIPWNKGLKGFRKGENANENNGMWKGEQVGKIALHNWVRVRKPKPELCEKCHKHLPKDLANISQKYKRDINDYEWLCRQCHMKTDGRLNYLIENYNKKFINRGNQYVSRDSLRGDLCNQ